MQTLEGLKKRIASAEELGSVVRTMKSLSAVHIRQFERSVLALRRYARTVDLGLQVVLRERLRAEPAGRGEPDPGRTAIVVFGSDYGLCGQFNDAIVEHALARLDELDVERDERIVASVGARAGSALLGRGHRSEELAAPSSVQGIEPCVRRLLVAIDAWRSERGASRVLLSYHEHRSASELQPRVVQLLPVDLARFRPVPGAEWPSRRLPTFTMDPERLLAALLRQFFTISLFRAFAESAASEHASRLRSMQAAERSIDEKLEELRVEFRRRRQDAITAELLDIVSGYEVLSSPEGS